MAAARVFLATLLLALIATASAGTGGLRAAGSDTAATTRRLSLHEHVARAGSTQFTDARHLAVNPDDELSVWSVLAPLSKEKYGDLLGKLDLYHSGVVVENESTGVNTTWEFTAVHFGSFFPKVEKLQNGSTHFEWDNGGFVVNPHPTDMEYWTQFRFMGHITGADYNTFVTGFIPQYNTTNRFYNLFAVKTTTGAVMHSSTCFDFQVAALRFLAGLPDAEFYASTLQRDNVFLHASALSPVNIHDPTNRANVAAFYSLIQSMPDLPKINMTELFSVDVEEVIGKCGGSAYYYAHGTYFRWVPASPYITVSFDTVPLSRDGST